MKNFVKHTLAIAICAAALLSSCIKEEAYVTQDVLIDVTLTRAGTSSAQQGDQIEDIMLWAFELSDSEVINEGKPIGWRQFTPPTTTYTSLNPHLPVKKCGKGGATYRLIAVLNRSTFTDASGNQITFGPNTTYEELTTGKFVSADLLAETPEEGKPGEPAVMPITHWADVEVAQSNVHDSNPHASVSIDVFRTVAKTQFYMACKSNQLFDVTIKELTLHCGAMPTEGVILSSLAPAELNDQSTTPAWFPSTAPNLGAAANYNLYTAPTAEGATPKMLTKYYEKRPTIADNETAAQYYDLIGSHFIYETRNASKTDIAATAEPTNDPGYYYKIVYEADGKLHTYYTGIPYSILRNHDYQIHALVEGGSGELTFTIEVNQWTVEETTLNYQDIATINSKGYIYWYDLPNIDDYHTWNYTNATGQVVDNPAYADDGINHKGEVNLTSAGGTTAKFRFMLDTPAPANNGTWIAELRPVGGMANSIVFDNGSSTMTGKIDHSVNELVIMNRADNLASAGGVTNIVELHISAKGSWGGEERSYRVIGIAGNGFDANFNYKIIQPAQ